MTDTVRCHACDTDLPAGAAFCTNCGIKMEAGGAQGSGASTMKRPVVSASSSPSAAEADATRVVTPGLHDPTQVLPDPARAQSSGQPDTTQVLAGSAPPGWSPPAHPDPAPWQPPPSAAAGAGAWQPPPPPPPTDWAQAGPPTGQLWPAPAAPTSPPSQWHQAAVKEWTPAHGLPVATKRRGSPVAAALAFTGAILLVVSVFALWLASTSGTPLKLTGWQMVTKKDEAGSLASPDPAILLGIAAAVVAVGALLVAGTVRLLMRILLAVAGIGAAVVLVRDYLSIKDAVKHTFDSGTTIDFKYGFWLAAAGAVVLLVGAAVPSRRKT